MSKETFQDKKRKILILLSIFLIAAITINMMETVNAKDITISSTTHSGLKQAIKVAKDGDTIYMQNGVYNGKNNTNIIINKNINIKGLGSNVVLDGERKNQIMEINKINVKVSLNNLKFTNGRAMEEIYDGSSGGAIISIGTLTVNNCTFTNNKASYAGAIFSESKCTIKNTIFINNKANGYGGAIQATQSYGGKLTISKSTFKDNKANNGGGAIWSEVLTLNSCTFTNNKADHGGAIDSYGTLTMNKCTFTKNNNNAIYVSGKTTVKSSTFKNNKASSGGAISADDTLTLKNCTFTKNTAKNNGGAIYTNIILDDLEDYSGHLSVDKCNFNNNKAGKRGGAIFNQNFKTIKNTNSKFTMNIAGNVYNTIYNQVKCKFTAKNVKITPKDGTKVKKY